MRALALGGRVGIESQPRNKYSLGTRGQGILRAPSSFLALWE